MSSTDSSRARIVTRPVPREANRYRWHVLRYLRACTYPASISELSESISLQVGTSPAFVEETIRERNLPALADCSAIEYDPESQLACLLDDSDSFVECVRRALNAGAISHLKPPRLDWLPATDVDSPGERDVPSLRRFSEHFFE